MKRIAVLSALVCAFAACTPVFELYIGTSTYDGGRGILTGSFNPRSGEWKLLDSVSCDNPTFLAFSEDGHFVYAVNENHGNDLSSIETFTWEGAKLKSVGKQVTDGACPCHISTNGQLLLAANYTGGNLSVFPLSDGVPGPHSQLLQGTVGGPDSLRQGKPHLHCAVFTPDGGHVLASDFSADRILSFKLDDSALEPDGSYAVAPDSGPRHITFSPDGEFAYAIGELSGAVTVFRYGEGMLEMVQSVPADSLGARGSADIHLSPDGRFLYASNRLKGDGIAIFAVNPADGTLSWAGYQDTGIHPRNFCISPDGRYVLCACRDSDCVNIFRRDAASGLLAPAGLVPVEAPMFVALVQERKKNRPGK